MRRWRSCRKPMKVERKEGAFTLKKDTAILVQQGSADAMNVGKQLADRINRSTGLTWRFRRRRKRRARSATRSCLPPRTPIAALGAEGYQLEVTPEGVVITAADGPGLFYGTQTLLQLLPPQVFSPNQGGRNGGLDRAGRANRRPAAISPGGG